MHLLPLLLSFIVAVLPSLTLARHHPSPLPFLNITELNETGLITLHPLSITTSTSINPTTSNLPTTAAVMVSRIASSCTTLPWTVRQVSAFTADPTDEVIDYSHVEFYFNDPNSNLESYCERKLPHGSGQSPIDPAHWYPCYNYGMSFLYAGTSVGLRRSFNCNGEHITAQGQAALGLQCYPIFNGTECQSVADVEVPITSVLG